MPLPQFNFIIVMKGKKMAFFIAMIVFVLAGIGITYKTLAGYSDFSDLVKFSILALLIIAWFSPIILGLLRYNAWMSISVYAGIAKASYFLMGLAFILLMLILLRETVWYIIYFISRNPALSPDNAELLNRNNLITVIAALLIAVYGVYEAHKVPAVNTITIENSRIKENVKMVVASDFHIDTSTPMRQIENFVNLINAQNPDYILLVGDIIDDVPEKLEKQMELLQKLKAKKIYLSLGNHEYYNAPGKWMIKFTQMGFDVLHNTGEKIADTGLFISGIPDASSARPDFASALYYADDDDYKILLSHAPKVIDILEPGQFDLQVSGHTHGGQIFPFNYVAEIANGYLAGEYTVHGDKLYVTRGAGYWGPPMRILAPSDIVVINFKAEADE